MLGIGGIGMSALARYYHSQGYTVVGYDRTPSPLTRQLENEGKGTPSLTLSSTRLPYRETSKSWKSCANATSRS